MVVYHIAGRADDPFFAQTEDLAGYISAELPDIKVVKYMVHPEDWQEFYQDTTRKLGFLQKNYDILVWTDIGRLIGDYGEFANHCHASYRAKLREPFETYVKIAEENMASAEYLRKKGEIPKLGKL